MRTLTTQLKQYAEKHSWLNQMNASKGLDSWSNYGGENLGHIVVVLGRNRDSDILEESNFESALYILGGESKTVVIHRFNHWGCGWFELLTVNPKNIKALKIAFEINQTLNSYGVLDDSDFSDRQTEYHSDYANGAKKDLAKALTLHFGLPEKYATNKDMLDLAYVLNMECQSYYGDDSCIDVYSCREPDDRDLSRLETILKYISYQYDLNPAYQYICACLEVGVTL